MEKDKFWQSPKYSLNFKANDDELKFDNRNLNANGNYSGSLSVLGLRLCLIERSLPASQLAADLLQFRFQADVFFLIQDF